jgi:hypothetical protein
MDTDVLKEQALFMIQMETCPQLSEFHLEVVMKFNTKMHYAAEAPKGQQAFKLR